MEMNTTTAFPELSVREALEVWSCGVLHFEVAFDVHSNTAQVRIGNGKMFAKRRTKAFLGSQTVLQRRKVLRPLLTPFFEDPRTLNLPSVDGLVIIVKS